jgi:hypothetical protein
MRASHAGPAARHPRVRQQEGRKHGESGSAHPRHCVSLRSGQASTSCCGYLRIPLTCKKRPTENWEEGQDLTVLDVWDAKNRPRCVPLKDLVERYDAISQFLLLRVRVRQLSEGAEMLQARRLACPRGGGDLAQLVRGAGEASTIGTGAATQVPPARRAVPGKAPG